jgi:hypothetical protein
MANAAPEENPVVKMALELMQYERVSEPINA